MVALYAELDENAKALKRISGPGNPRFLSNMSHEFRSPLELHPEPLRIPPGPERRRTDCRNRRSGSASFAKAAASLATLVNDLLDLAKVEAGKAVIRPVVRGRRPPSRPRE